jgi:hypothetical protein
LGCPLLKASNTACAPPCTAQGKLGKALLRKFDDAGEANRELAVSTLSGLLQV